MLATHKQRLMRARSPASWRGHGVGQPASRSDSANIAGVTVAMPGILTEPAHDNMLTPALKRIHGRPR